MSDRSEACFARFTGTMDYDRAKQLFGDVSIGERLLGLSVWAIAAAVVFAITFFAGRAHEDTVLLVISIAVSTGMLVIGVIQQTPVWMARRWRKWNSCLIGEYECELHEDVVVFRTDSIGYRLPYSMFGNIDNGRSAVRMSLDGNNFRSLLMPVADMQPVRSVKEIIQFAKGRRADLIRQPETVSQYSADVLPLGEERPNAPRIDIEGVVNQNIVLEVMESQDGQRLQRRVNGIAAGVFMILVPAILILLPFSDVELDAGLIIKLIGIGVFVFAFLISLLNRRRKIAELEADPEQDAPVMRGWISGDAMMQTGGGIVYSVRLAACESIECSEQAIRLKFWSGDFMIASRNMFASERDFERATQLVTAGSS